MPGSTGMTPLFLPIPGQKRKRVPSGVPLCFCYLNPVILSERSESKDLRTFDLYRRHLVRRSFDSFQKSAIFFSRSG